MLQFVSSKIIFYIGRMIRCCSCQLEKSVSDFAWKNKQRGTRAKECRECHKIIRRAYYLKNRTKEIAYAMKTNKARKPKIKEIYRALKKTLKCSRCPEKHPATLHFHHSDPKSKAKTVSQMVQRGFTMKAITKEMEKCEVLCANCHLKEHNGHLFAE